MDIHTLQTALDTLNGRIARLESAAPTTDWSKGLMLGLMTARSDLQYILDTEVMYRDSRATRKEVA